MSQNTYESYRLLCLIIIPNKMYEEILFDIHTTDMKTRTTTGCAKKVIVFSPHPDDDVISMGGTIRRGKARTACTYNEIPLDHVHFLENVVYFTKSSTW